MDLTDRQIATAIHLADRIEVDFMSAKSGPTAWIAACATLTAIEAVRALIDTDPEDATAIRKLQNEIHRQRDVMTWLEQAVINGKAAYQKLSDEEQQEMQALLGKEDPET